MTVTCLPARGNIPSKYQRKFFYSYVTSIFRAIPSISPTEAENTMKLKKVTRLANIASELWRTKIQNLTPWLAGFFNCIIKENGKSSYLKGSKLSQHGRKKGRMFGLSADSLPVIPYHAVQRSTRTVQNSAVIQ